MVGVEGPDHGKAALEGLDEVAVLLLDRGFIRHAQPPAAPAVLPGQTCRTGAGRGAGGGVICQMITIVDSSLPVRFLNYRASYGLKGFQSHACHFAYSSRNSRGRPRWPAAFPSASAGRGGFRRCREQDAGVLRGPPARRA